MNIKKHLLLCATPTKQKCFKGNEGQKTWECLKKTLKKFENDPSTKNVHILRSKADCLSNDKPIEKWIFKKTPFLNIPRYL